MRGGGGRGVATTMITKSHHHYSSPYTTTTTTTATATDSWAHHRNHQDLDQYMIDGSGGGGGWGLSWPPRFYTCNFCRREFRSAQALGGHMNVHRRDRARLRVQSPQLAPISPNYTPNLNLNLIPNPNPNPTAPTLPSPSTTHQNHLLQRYRKQVGPAISPRCAAIFDPKKLLVMRRPRNLSAKTSKGRGAVKLGLEIGIYDDDEDDEEEDLEVGLDLELRLGYKH